MLTLELWEKNDKGVRTYQGTYRRKWKTMRGLENYRKTLIEKYGYTLEDFKIKGEEAEKTNNAIGKLKVGDIMHASWGYDMTINDFYEVVEVSKTGKTVKIRPIAARYDGSPNDIGGCKAFPDIINEHRFTGKAETKKVLDCHGEPCLKINSFNYAFPMELEDAVYGACEDHND